MRFALLALAMMACGGKTTPTDTGSETTSATTTTSTTSTATTTTTTTATTTTTQATRSGTYTGTLHIDIVDIGFVQNPDSCDATMTVHVDEQGDPQITSVTPCDMVGSLSGNTMTVTLNGDISADPAAGGDIAIVWLEQSPIDLWTGEFTDADTFEGHFEGDTPRVSWDATFSVSR